MKFVIALCLIAVAFAAPAEERRFIESIGLGFAGSLFDMDTLKCDVQLMLDVVGADPTEKACEDECHNLLTQGHVLNYGCPLVCHGFQTLVKTWHVAPGNNLCQGGQTMVPTTTMSA